MSANRLLLIDAQISASLRIPDTRPALKTAAAVLAHSADSWFWLAGLALIWLLGPAAWRAEILLLIISITATAALVLLLKFVIQRPRPEGEWGQVYRGSDPHSFPSGHAARASLLTLLAFLLGCPWIGFGLILWTLLVILARIALGVHYLLDMIVGALIGLLSAAASFLIYQSLF